MRINYCVVFCVSLLTLISISATSVNAFPQFNGGFKKLYLNDDSPDEFKNAVKEAKCAVCHDESKKKDDGKPNRKFRNPYGEALDKLLSKDDKKDKEKIREALENVEKEKLPDSDVTFGARLKAHKLPFVPDE